MATSNAAERSARAVRPPGMILQHLYLRERFADIAPGNFVEVGVGSGHLSGLLLARGWSGVGYDLSASALTRAARMNAAFVASGHFALRNEDWLSSLRRESVDLVISSMVIEHLDDEQVRRYFQRAASVLRPGGRGVLLVPGSPRHWGIEDEIAGHFRRYTAESLVATVRRHGWRTLHIAGLTHPLSNMLLGLSNVRVRRAEGEKLALTLQERTEHSGDRNVSWKTDFPGWVGLLVNETTMRPFHRWQKRDRASADALVIYCECRPLEQGIAAPDQREPRPPAPGASGGERARRA